MIYSIIPEEVIFSDMQNENNSVDEYKEIEYKGYLLQVSLEKDNGFKIQRIISTDPYAYLNSEIQPGNIIYGNII
ncbi:YlzJ-like family protein [Defluviitalea saccharophila]|uniref:YlzJ-like family protein n=1 Tax=Defluviitalea saccharophila TaxID=879970 RepID=A0ABZ2Y748_9FIRM